jgi:3-oxoacyl-[acyl-carrier protein] reductase
MDARCVVFGGSGAVGRAVCRRLVAEGARVGFTWHENEAAARALEAELPGAMSRRVDLSRPGAAGGAARALAEALGGATAFVHCAALGSTLGRGRYEALEELDEAGWDDLMAVNVRAAAFAVRALAPAMAACGGGNAVFLGSVDADKPVPSPAGYAASKGALVGLAHALAKELGRSRIAVNIVAPGMLDDGISLAAPAKLRAEYAKHCGLKRPGTADEVARVVAFFALRNRYVTAQTVLVDGGL